MLIHYILAVIAKKLFHILSTKIKIISGTLILIPTVLSELQTASIPLETITAIHNTRHFVVERARTARRYIKSTAPPYAIQDLNIVEIEKNSNGHIDIVMAWLEDGKNVGVISESGMPAIADPGSNIVSIAHKRGYTVKAYSGPSSIMLSLSASGLNGQNFCFHGYLPVKDVELISTIKNLEASVNRFKQTQIFIETPYRNDRMFEFLLKYLSSHIQLCIARDLTGSEEFIKTKSIENWKKNVFKIGKVPTIFLIGQ
jgi:16S rRNA (cytidine1402-2'-O)-methyltransferase